MEKSTLHLFALLVFVSTFICWTKAGILRVNEEPYCELQFKPCSDGKYWNFQSLIFKSSDRGSLKDLMTTPEN